LAFSYCGDLTNISFRGNAPSLGSDVFSNSDNATVYYLPGTTGWENTFAGRPTELWELPYPVILTTAPNLGVLGNEFGFTISWATNASVAVDVATDLGSPTWSAVSTNVLSEGVTQFSDADRADQPSRFYRLRQL